MKVSAADLQDPAPAAPASSARSPSTCSSGASGSPRRSSLAATAIWGSEGALSAPVAIAVVLVNLALAAVSLSWAARRSLTLVMAVALGGFAARMGLVTVVLLLVGDQSWIDLAALGVTVLVTHLRAPVLGAALRVRVPRLSGAQAG